MREGANGENICIKKNDFRELGETKNMEFCKDSIEIKTAYEIR
jgi:hypothetical protein